MSKAKPVEKVVESSLEKNVLAVKLELRIITHADGSVKLHADLTHHCKDKQDAINLISEYVNHNTRKKVVA